MKSIGWVFALMVQAAPGQNWVAGSGSLPSLAAQAGYDLGNVPLYICRTVNQQGDTFAGKFSANFGCVYFHGSAVAPSSYQILTDYSIDWRQAADGSIPAGSYHAGGGVYICRAYVENSLQVGQVRAGSPGCEIEFGQTGGYFPTYEVMYSPWTQASNGSIPSGAFQGGTDNDGQPLYVCRGVSNGVQHLGKIKPGTSGCRAGAGNTPFLFNYYEVLTNFSGSWQTYNNSVPAGGAYFAGSGGGAAKYVCRFNVQGTNGLTPGQTGGSDSINRCNIEYGNGVKDSGSFQALRQQETQGVCNYTASPASINAPAGGSSVTITMTGGCGWVNFPSAPWLRPSKRSGTAGSFVLTIDPNPSPSARTGTVVAGGITISISQAGACSYVLSPNPVIIGAAAGTKTIGVTTTAGCSWSAITAHSWIHISNPSGSGSGIIVLHIDANSGATSRNGSVFVNGQGVTVTQAGACFYTVYPQAPTLEPEASNLQLNPSSNPGCTATASSSAAWMTITPGPVTGGFTVSVQANTGYAGRTGYITVSTGQTVVITQYGKPCTISSAASAAVPRGGGPMAIPVTVPSGCSWSVTTNDTFLHITSAGGQGAGYVYLNADAHAGTSRQGTIMVSAYRSNAPVVINQSDALCNFSVSTPAQVAAEGGTATVTVTGGSGCQAAFSYTEPWILSPILVTGPGTYGITVLVNPTFAERSQTVKLGPASFTLTQRGQPCTISVSSPPAVPANGGPFSIHVTLPSSCQWSSSEASTFAQLDAPASGTGNGQLTGTLSANPSNSARAAAILFTSYLSSATATVNQNGTTCSYTVSPQSIQAGAQGGTEAVNVTAPGGCAWNAITTDTSWISFPSVSSGSGSGSLTIQIAPNQGGTTRVASISAGGQSITITQSAAACVYTLGVSGMSAAATGGPGSVTVTTAAGCPWTVSSTDSWVVIHSSPDNSGPGVVAFSVLGNTASNQRVSNLTIAGRVYTITQSGTATGGTGLTFAALPPCRILETREIYNFEGRTGAFGPPYLRAAETRTLPMTSSNICAIPTTAKAYVVNITIVPRGAVDYVTVWPAGEARPNVWSIRSPDGNIVANSAIVKAGVNGAISVYSSNNTDILMDVTGYFTDSAPTSLVYYPVTPCRVIETREAYRPAGLFGAPSMTSRETRAFRFPDYAPCALPAGVAAYSMTITAVPKGPLQYLTAWPAGLAQPNVSSINSPAGRVLANSVILPASPDGSINVHAFNATDFLIDVNGYFAPDDGVNGQYYYPVTQCRASDSTTGGGIYGDDSTRTIDVPAAPGCLGIPASARGYALNVTALPSGNPMPFLTAYPAGENFPNASILNAFEGQIVTNSAIIPAGEGGKINLYAYRRTHVVVEVSGYFGR